MNLSTRSSSIRLLALLALIADASVTTAQAADSPEEPPAGTGSLASSTDANPVEVVVTAQKRTQNL